MDKIKQVVWKYSLSFASKVQSIDIPIKYRLLCTKWLDGPTVWALVDPNTKKTPKLFRVYATGEKLDDNYTHVYIGTCFQKTINMTYVWHVFQVIQLEK
jgi:hypothetical protein